MSNPTEKPVPEEVLLQRLVTENQQIDQYIQLLNSQQITDAQQFQYNSLHSDTLTTVYKYMFILYFVIVLVAKIDPRQFRHRGRLRNDVAHRERVDMLL